MYSAPCWRVYWCIGGAGSVSRGDHSSRSEMRIPLLSNGLSMSGWSPLSIFKAGVIDANVTYGGDVEAEIMISWALTSQRAGERGRERERAGSHSHIYSSGCCCSNAWVKCFQFSMMHFPWMFVFQETQCKYSVHWIQSLQIIDIKVYLFIYLRLIIDCILYHSTL